MWVQNKQTKFSMKLTSHTRTTTKKNRQRFITEKSRITPLEMFYIIFSAKKKQEKNRKKLMKLW